MMLTWLDPGFCNLFVHLFWGPELLTWDFTQKPRVGLHHDAVSSDSPSLKPVCQSAAARLLNWASSIYKSFLLSHFRVPAAKPASQKHPFTSFMPHPFPTLVSKRTLNMKSRQALLQKNSSVLQQACPQLSEAWSLLRPSGNIPTVLLVAHAQDDLRGSVISRHHIGRHHEACARCPGQSEVKDFQCAIRLDYYVTGL